MDKMQWSASERQQQRRAEKRPFTLSGNNENMTTANCDTVKFSTSKRKRLLENFEENDTAYAFNNGCKFCNGLNFCWWHNVD